MIKPQSLRAALVALQPSLARDPDKLVMWVDQGTIHSNSTPELGFAYRYRLNVLLVDFADEPSIIMLAVTNWLRQNQPERVVPGQAAFAIEVDMIDSNTVDLQLQIQLDENVLVTARENGGFDLQHLSEPVPLFDDDLPLIGSDGEPAPGTPPLAEIADEDGSLPPWH
ncbi:MAG: tail protein [Blastomonas sp. CACIA14H2]|uniref:phage tail protein n=1 Tax=Blastomonas sp. CACIA14H2 TaxID=1419876 RepID=UPI0003CFAC17|nr:MAG: tail protein [Blastomonas sp. CACIA14H2]